MDIVDRHYTNVCPDYLFVGATWPVFGVTFLVRRLPGRVH